MQTYASPRFEQKKGAFPNPRLQTLQLGDLAYAADGPTRGYSHIGFADHPAQAPGHLDFEPLVLFAQGCMQPGEGFAMHRHENIENITVLRSGRMAHRDSLGTSRVFEPGTVCNFSTGRGAEHEETVHGEEPVDALVIWLRPRAPGAEPKISWTARAPAAERGRWAVLASGRAIPTAHPVSLDCDAELLCTRLRAGASISHRIEPDRCAYAIGLEGAFTVDGRPVEAGGRVLAEGEGTLTFTATEATELFLVDLPAAARTGASLRL